MNRKSGKFDDVLDSLSFSSSSDNNVGGLDEALQQFAAKKAQAIRSRRGPIEGIPDDESVPEQFEIAEDAMLSAQLVGDNEDVKPVNLPSSAPTGDVSHSIKRIDILSDEISSSTPGTNVRRQASTQNANFHFPSISVNPPSSSSPQRRWTYPSHFHLQHRRPRTTLPSGADRAHSVYLKPSDIVTRSTYSHGVLRVKEKSEEGVVTMNSDVTSSLPDLHEGKDGSLRLKCFMSKNGVCSKNLTTIDQNKGNGLFEWEIQPVVPPPQTPKRPLKPPTPRPVLTSTSPKLFEYSASPPINLTTAEPPVTTAAGSSLPSHPTIDSSFISQLSSPQQDEVFNKPDIPVRRRKKLFSNEKMNEGSSSAGVKMSVDGESAVISTKPESTRNNAMLETASDRGQFSDASENSKTTLFGLITEDLLRLLKRNSLLVFIVFSFTIFFLWHFSVGPFLSGALLGGGSVYVFMRFWTFTMHYLNTHSPEYHPEDCIFTRGGVGCGANLSIITSPTATCCSLHNSLLADWRPAYAGPLILPQLRELQAPPVPNLSDEDPKTGPTGGHLGEGLGFKLDKNNKPLYQAWMNETISYSSETYHINNTHSVFVTLEGTQLRIQRPRKNVPRRAMFNVSVPSSSGVQFVHQRIYDMRKVTVSLLPEGLVAKRFWSKKYPICLTIQSEQNVRSNRSQDTPTKVSILRNKQASTVPQSDTTSIAAYPPPTALIREETKSVNLDSQSLYSVSTSRFLRVSTNPSVSSSTTGSTSRGIPVSKLDDVLAQTQDDFLLVQPSDLDDKIYLFTRTCREKETWFRRLYGASIGKPLLLTTQQALKQLETVSTSRIKSIASETQMQTSASFNDITTAAAQAANSTPYGSSFSSTIAPLSTTGSSVDDYYDPDLQVAYLRYMAKFVPAPWLSRAILALKVNLNFVKTDSQLPWLNALIGRLAWDFLRHERWQRRIQEKIQAKIKKMKFTSLLNEPIVTNVEMGNELPVITNVGKPYLDNQGLWFELEVVYTGGFTVSFQTTVNSKKLEKISRLNSSAGQSSSPVSSVSSTAPATSPPPVLEPSARSLAAFLSDEEDSADSSTDSERETTLTRAIASLLPNSNPPVDPSIATNNPNTPTSLSNPSYKLPAEAEDTDAIPTGAAKGRFHRIFDRITRSLYVQMADSRLVQYSLDLVTQTTLHLKLEVTMLHGTLVVNIPPPPSNRLWYGFRGNPNLRVKVKSKVGEYLFNFPRILEIIEKRIITEFQRVVVLPNMDDLVMPMLFSEEILERSSTAESKPENSQTDDTPTPPQHLLLQKMQDVPEKADANRSRANTPI
ncbi:unnamed protein product [Hymenolepis diminuta]|uniref:SMP-LTD domain-containing protein n=2 Tax=Hymenolepis diminuta TaxID=6216 RepID=A0A564Y8L4_HYMDI|nr:unnamed protein product [Hymenolepis diminuta]